MNKVRREKQVPKWLNLKTYEPLRHYPDATIVEQLNLRFDTLSWLDSLKSNKDSDGSPLIKTTFRDYFHGERFDEEDRKMLGEVSNIGFDDDFIISLTLPRSGALRNISQLHYSPETPAFFEAGLITGATLTYYEEFGVNLESYTDEELIFQFKHCLKLARQKLQCKPPKRALITGRHKKKIQMIRDNHLIAIADIKIWETVNNVKFEEDSIIRALFFGHDLDYRSSVLGSFKSFKNQFDDGRRSTLLP